MAYKLGFLLSLIFIVQLFLIAGDLLAVQAIYTNLDAVSVTAGQIISIKGGITTEVVALVERETQGTITAIGDNVPMFGSPFEYKISKTYNPSILSTKEMEIAVKRSVVIGYYN